MTGWRSSVCSVGARRVSWLEAELREQPAALARLIDKQAGRAREIADAYFDTRVVLPRLLDVACS